MVDLVDSPTIEGALRREAAPQSPRRLDALRSRLNPRLWKAYAPLILVAFAVGFGLWLLRPELRNVPYPNDASTHASFARFAAQRIRSGHSPFDAWYPYLGLGSPQFLQYQVLSHVLTGFLSLLFGDATFRWANYLLLCTWPISVYIGARLLGFDRWQAGASALFSPMLVNVVGYGFEWGSFLWLGSGMWSMLWALWTMPIAIGLAWRAVSRGEHYARAAFAVGLTCAFHFITGYLVLLSLGVFVIVSPPSFLRRAWRGVLLGASSLLSFAFIFVPTLGGLRYVAVNTFQVGTFWQDSYGPGTVFTWLIHGRIFDSGRHPVVSLLVAVGAIVCLLRSWRNETARLPLGLMILSLLLYSGRGVVGFIINRLPGGPDLLLHRYIIGVHFAGMLLAGVGSVWLCRSGYRLLKFVVRLPGRRFIAAALVLGLSGFALWPVLVNRYDYAKFDKVLIAGQSETDSQELQPMYHLIDIAKRLGGGRIYAGLPSNWGSTAKIDQVDVLYLPLQRDADSLGFTLRTDSLNQDIEAYFDESNPAQYNLFDVMYLLLPPNHEPPVPAKELAVSEGFSLWKVDDVSGYLEVVDTVEPTAADRANISSVFAGPGHYMSSPLVAEQRTPLVAFDGGSTPPSSSSYTAPYTGSPGRVLTSSESLDNGRFEGTVTANHASWVMLKESYAPHWRATVDGKPVKTAMLAPAFVGVPVPAGTHHVVFQYHSQSDYPLLFAIGALTLIALAVGPSQWRRFRARRTREPAETAAVAD